jgi:hypothetical protein
VELTLIFVLTAHLLCVNVASGAPLLAAWLDWRGRRGEEAAARGAIYLARGAIAGLLAGALLGIVVGWLKWDADYRAVWLGPLSYKMWWAIIEAVFSLVLLLGWWLWLPRAASGAAWAATVRGILAFLASTNLVYHFPVLFSVASRLIDEEQTHGEPIRGAEFRRLMMLGPTPALAVHVALASLAAAGILLLGLALRSLRQGEGASAEKFSRWGGRTALVASLLQLPVGLWTLTALPAAAQSQLIGESTAGTLVFVAAMAAALWLINELAQISLGENTRPRLIRAMAAFVATVLLMVAMQQRSRPDLRPLSAISTSNRH